MNEKRVLHYLSPEEEVSIKASIPWNKIDKGVRALVALANKIDGIVTVQSCVGHIKEDTKTFAIDSAGIAFKSNRKRAIEFLFEAIPQSQINDVEIRYFHDGTFWLYIMSDPAEQDKLKDVFNYVLKG